MLFQADWNDRLILAGVEAVLEYISESKLGHFEFSLLFACYYLGRRYKCDYLTDAAHDLATEAILKISCRSNIERDIMAEVLPLELGRYAAQEAFTDKQGPNETAFKWWSRQTDAGMLRNIGLRLSCLKSSSANIERSFSNLKQIIGHNRENLNLDTLESLSRVKLDLLLKSRETVGIFYCSSSSDDEDESDNELAMTPRSPRTSSRCSTPNTYGSQIFGDIRENRLSSSKLRASYKLFVELIDFDYQ